ncbi:MAG: GFA family protein [Pseudomonadota bacterium]
MGDVKTTPLQGGCLCGEVRYEVDAPATHRTACHCTICRRASAAPFVAWFSVPTNAFRLLAGEPARFSSSAHGVRTFCASCGSPLTFQSSRSPEQIDVTTCSLDTPDAAAPRDHTYVRSKLSWVVIGDGVSAYNTERTSRP